MGWPTPQDYNEAVQNPQHNFGDPELQRGKIDINAMGLPRVASGAFASVYRIRCGERGYAVRCFLQPVIDQQERYQAISTFVLSDKLDCTVTFEYVTQGIRVHGKWYPILKMEWVSGSTLDEYVRSNLNSSSVLTSLANNFQTMLVEMHADGIAHGDLQHGNIIVTNDGKIRLVDYDGMYVPSLAGFHCPELGHRNYQHPGRTAKHFGPYLDNFAAWSIYSSLVCLSRDPLLLERLKGGDESLLFRSFDYKNPTRSHVFAALEQHRDPEINHLSKVLRTLVQMPVENIPLIGSPIQIADAMPLITANLPDWMNSSEGSGNDTDFDIHNEPLRPKVVAATNRDSWPTMRQYLGALETPASCFTDQILRKCNQVRLKGKIWSVSTDDYATFFLSPPATEQTSDCIAVKVLLRPDKSFQLQHEEFSIFLNALGTKAKELYEFFPEYRYLPNGIRVGNGNYPILIMDWNEGPTLKKLLSNSRRAKKAVGSLTTAVKLAHAKKELRSLCSIMSTLAIVHGDLDPVNLVLSSGGLRIRDFERVHFHGKAMEQHDDSIGSLRHPEEPAFIDEYSDRYPSWVIDSALILLETRPELGSTMPRLLSEIGLRMKSGAPLSATHSLIGALEHGPSKILRQRAQLLKIFLKIHRKEIPPLAPGAAISKEFAQKYALTFGEVPENSNAVSPDLVRGVVSSVPVRKNAIPETNLAVAPQVLSNLPSTIAPKNEVLSLFKGMGSVALTGLLCYWFGPVVLLMVGVVLTIRLLQKRTP